LYLKRYFGLRVGALKNNTDSILDAKNPKYEARNPKQYQNTNFQMFQTLKATIYTSFHNDIPKRGGAA